MEPQHASRSHAVLVEWMALTDANIAGSVHGGTVMKLCDECAAIAAVRHCRSRVVTVAMDRMTFLLPIEVGELLTLRASVNATWRTSMEVGVRVEAENPLTGVVRHTNSAYLTMVALGEDGRPVPVPALIVDDPAGERREREAQLRRRSALAERELILRERTAEGEALVP